MRYELVMAVLAAVGFRYPTRGLAMRYMAALALTLTFAFASGDEVQRMKRLPLRGVGKVFVVVDLTNSEKRLGLTKQEIKTAVELRLRANRIPLSDREGTPFVHASVTVSSNGRDAAFGASLQLRQRVVVQANGENVGAITWHKDIVGGATNLDLFRAEILAAVNALVDEFSNDYLAAQELGVDPAGR
jgi:hypothetical protein